MERLSVQGSSAKESSTKESSDKDQATKNQATSSIAAQPADTSKAEADTSSKTPSRAEVSETEASEAEKADKEGARATVTRSTTTRSTDTDKTAAVTPSQPVETATTTKTPTADADAVKVTQTEAKDASSVKTASSSSDGVLLGGEADKYITNLQKYTTEVNGNVVRAILKSFGDAVNDRDAMTVACAQPKELRYIKTNLLRGRLDLQGSDEVLDRAMDEVCEQMGRSNRNKSSVTFYYLLSEKFAKLPVWLA